MNFRFQDRADAGRLLADKLSRYAGRGDVVILALPRGGVPVAFEVARKLHIPFYAFVVRKLGVPGQDELALGAIASGEVVVYNESVIHSLRIPEKAVNKVLERETAELHRREQAFGADSIPSLAERIVILIDDGLATGATMRAAVSAARKRAPARIIVAAPIAAEDIFFDFQLEADEVVCVLTPALLEGVGQWYEDFSQTNDEEVRNLLSQGMNFRRAAAEQEEKL